MANKGKIYGKGRNQVAVRGDLGSMAFQNHDSAHMKKAKIHDLTVVNGIKGLGEVMSMATAYATKQATNNVLNSSGFVEFGRNRNTNVSALGYTPGLWTDTTETEAIIHLGSNSNTQPLRNPYPIVNVNGWTIHLKSTYINSETDAAVRLPRAINKTDDNPSSNVKATTRQDAIYLEVWVEIIDEKGWVFPFGNVQSGLTSYSYAGTSTTLRQPENINIGYFKTSDHDPDPTKGTGAVWAELTVAQRRSWINNPHNNIFNDGDKLQQVRYRLRAVKNVPPMVHPITNMIAATDITWMAVRGKLEDDVNYDSLGSFTTDPFYRRGSATTGANNGDEVVWQTWDGSTNKSDYTEDQVYLIPICIISRLNEGAYHPVYNPFGAAQFLNTDATTEAYWYNTDQTVVAVGDCFNLSQRVNGDSASGKSGRPDGLYYNQIVRRNVFDLRYDAAPNADLASYRRQIQGNLEGAFILGWEAGPKGFRAQLGTVSVSGGRTRLSNFSHTYYEAHIAGETFSATSDDRQTDDNKFDLSSLIGGYIFNPVSNLIYKIQPSLTNSTNIYLDKVISGVPTVGDWTADITTGTEVHVFLRGDIRSAGGLMTGTHIHPWSTLSKFSRPLWCDIIGAPSSWPSNFGTSGVGPSVSGYPLIVQEDDVSSYLPNGSRTDWMLSRRPHLAVLSKPHQVVLYASGTYTILAESADWTYNYQTNTITFTTPPASNHVILVFYTTYAHPGIPIGGVGFRVLDNLSNVTVSFRGDGSTAENPLNMVNILNVVSRRITRTTNNTDKIEYGLTVLRDNIVNIAAQPFYRFGQTKNILHYQSTINHTADAIGVKWVTAIGFYGSSCLSMLVLYKEIVSDGASYGDTDQFESASTLINSRYTTTDTNGKTIYTGGFIVELPRVISRNARASS